MGRGKREGGMQTRNASRMRSNGPGELLADRREGSTGSEQLGLRAAGMRRRIEFFGAEYKKEKEDLAFCQEGRLERDSESRLFRLIKRIVGRFPFHAAVYYYTKF